MKNYARPAAPLIKAESQLQILSRKRLGPNWCKEENQGEKSKRKMRGNRE